MNKTDCQKHKPPTFRFKNVGPVKNAELELGDLTIIAGRNNTGKTYLAYTLYGFLKMWKRWLDTDALLALVTNDCVDFPDIYSITDKVNREGRVSFPLDRKQFSRQQRTVIQELARNFSEDALSSVFSAYQSDFHRSHLDVKPNEDISEGSHVVKEKIGESDSLSIEYDGSNVVVSTNKVKNQQLIPDLGLNIIHQYFLLLLHNQLPDPFILSAERFGISLFYKELDFTKNQLVDLLQKLGENKNTDRISPFLFVDRTTSRYALPIKDNIDFTRDISDLQKRKSEIFESKLFDDIKDMMDGYYGSSSDDIRFISKTRKQEGKFNILLHLASSSARELVDLYFFLKHVAKKNHLLIIDEPESHLDTSNQILLARLLARCVRAGLKVLITTHSDYLIKEINNLVMLSRPFEDKEAVIKKLKYSPDDFLDSESVRAYVAEDNSLTRCDVDRFGIDMPVFDETIDEINRVANDLASRMSEDSEA
ncbi:MAG: AAA family ATPase [Candidatus Poribacteria bacterium]|nr:AAA family ATPase [Candidatus Poribacteria bacterium]